MAEKSIRYLIIPGWHGSSPEHWQSHWHRILPGAVRLEQDDWVRPEPGAWTGALDAAVQQLSAHSVVLVAHSLGCVTVARWANAGTQTAAHVSGALLVAPADVERQDAAPALRGFGPVPMRALPFPSVLVGSTDDHAATADRAIAFGRAWGSATTILERAGHINVDSGHRRWEAGLRFLHQLQQITRPDSPRIAHARQNRFTPWNGDARELWPNLCI